MKNPPVTNVISLRKIADYWEGLKPQSGIKISEAELWIKRAEFLDQISQENNVVIFLWDIYKNRFLYMGDKIKLLAGVDPASYTAENGIEFSFSRLHPDQLNAALLFTQAGIDHIEKNNLAGSKDVVVSLNFLYRNALNEYVQLLQKTSVLELDDVGKPSLAISFVHYVGHIKKYESVDYTVSTPSGIRMFTYNKEKKCLEKPQEFSAQEKNIIQLLSQGLTTKQIADKLGITVHTVHTHRRNLIKKTNCHDSTGVVAFARLINLI